MPRHTSILLVTSALLLPAAHASDPLAGPPSAEQASIDGSFSEYKKRDDAAAWVEYLQKRPSPEFREKAGRALAGRLARDVNTKVTLGKVSPVECKPATLTLSEMASHMDDLGSEWKYYCDQGSFSWQIFNPTSEALVVRGTAYGVKLEATIQSGSKASGTATMTSPCTNGEHRFSRGRVTFGCRAELILTQAALSE